MKSITKTIGLLTLVGTWAMTNSAVAMANDNQTTFKVTVTNIDVKRGGNINVMIFAENGFPKIHNKAVLAQTQETSQKTITFSFTTDMKTLAIKIHHDEDGNGKVTKNWTGIWPKEGLGFSNNQKVSLTGAPEYKKSKLSYEQFKDGLSIPILYP